MTILPNSTEEGRTLGPLEEVHEASAAGASAGAAQALEKAGLLIAEASPRAFRKQVTLQAPHAEYA